MAVFTKHLKQERFCSIWSLHFIWWVLQSLS